VHSFDSHVAWKCLILAEAEYGQQECNLQGVTVVYSKKVDGLGTTAPVLLRNEKRRRKKRGRKIKNGK
jgi:hypothetical protein